MKLISKKITTLFLTLVLTACALNQPAPTATPTATSIPLTPTESGPTPIPPPALGSPEYPINILFVPTVNAAYIAAGAEKLAAELRASTGMEFDIRIPNSYAETIEALCESPKETIAFLPGLGYALANETCGAKVGGKAVRFDLDWYASMIVVLRNSPYQSLADLNGKKWAYTDDLSVSGYLYPLYMFQQAGITPAESLATGSHDAAIRAVYYGQADFATAYWSPANVDNISLAESLGKDTLLTPDIPLEILPTCASTSNNDTVLCGNYEPRDARRSIRKEVSDAFKRLRILAVTPAFSNDTLTFGAEFDDAVMEQIMQALYDFADNDPEGFKAAMEAYSWMGINPATDEDYLDVHNAIKASGITIEALR